MIHYCRNDCRIVTHDPNHEREAMSCERTLYLRRECFSNTLKMSTTVTNPRTLPWSSTTGKHFLSTWHIFSIIAASNVSGLMVQVGLLIIHLTLIRSVASSIGRRHLTKTERKYGLIAPVRSLFDTIPSGTCSLPIIM